MKSIVPPESSQKGKFALSEGVLLGVIPVVVYALGFSYETGYLSFYGVPSSLVSIDAPAMVSATVFGALYVFALLLWASLAVDSSGGESYFEKSIGLVMLYFGLFPVLFLLFMGAEYLSVVMFLSFGAMFVILLLRSLEARWSWLQRFSIKTHRVLSGAFGPEEVENERRSALNSLRAGGAMILIVMIPFLLAFAAGRNNAKDESFYNVIRNELGEVAVVRIYGDKIIAIPFDRGEKSFKREFLVIKTDSLSNVVFRSEEVGPLQQLPGKGRNKI